MVKKIKGKKRLNQLLDTENSHAQNTLKPWGLEITFT